MSPRSVVAFVAVLLLVPVGVAPAAGVGGSVPGSTVSDPTGAADLRAPHNGSLDPGEVSMRVELHPDGDARWYVKTVVAVENGDERAAFEELVRQFNRSESPLGLEAFKTAAENASAATGREMTIRNIQRHHALHNGTGALWIAFTWENFARVSDDRLAVGDGFNTTDGTWLPSLSADERLVVVPPEGYGVSSVPTGSSAAPTSISNGVARWVGPQDFGDRGPWIVYSGDASTATPTQTPTTSSGPGPRTGTTTPTDGGPTTGTGGPPGGDGTGDGPLSGALPFVVVVVLAGASAAVLAVYVRGRDGGVGALLESGEGGDGGPSDSGETAGTDAAASATDGGGAGGAVEDGTADGGGASAAAGAAGAGASAADSDADDGADAEDDEIDEELLSDEERVERLLERNGGRMKQAAIVQETGWSNAKVSQLLSGMDEDDRIDKLRIGRENLISFPDEDVTDLDSE